MVKIRKITCPSGTLTSTSGYNLYLVRFDGILAWEDVEKLQEKHRNVDPYFVSISHTHLAMFHADELAVMTYVMKILEDI